MLSAVGCTSTQNFLVGTYTEGTGAEGVYLYSLNEKNADFKQLSVAQAGNPSFVIAAPDGKHVYSVNEYNDGRQGVSAYLLEQNNLQLVNTVQIPTSEVDGADPCNLLWTGDAIVSSNYTGGSVTAFSIGPDGSVSGLSQVGIETSGAHMHCAALSTDWEYIFVADLGSDCIHRFNRGQGAQPLGAPEVAWKNPEGEKFGPRHLIFSADGHFAYLLCELSDNLVVFSYSDGSLTPIQTLKAYEGAGHGSADLHLSPDGKFLYTSHRLKEDGIAIFSVNPATGLVIPEGYQPTGIHPRNFAITPSGRYLLCACRDSNRIEIYERNPKTGALKNTGKTISVPAPVCVQFL